MHVKWLSFCSKLCVYGDSHLISDLLVSSLVDKLSVLMVLSLHFQLGESFDDVLHFYALQFMVPLSSFLVARVWDERFLKVTRIFFFCTVLDVDPYFIAFLFF